MQDEAFHILEEKAVYSSEFVRQDPFNFKEEGAPGIGKTFPGTSGAKCLAREAAKQDLKFGNVFTLNSSNIGRVNILTREVMVECRDCRCFDFRSENAAAL